MSSVETHYAAQRQSPHTSPTTSRSKRPIATIDSPDQTHKRLRKEIIIDTKEQNLSPHGRDIQNLMRKRLQSRLHAEQDDSVELESRTLQTETGLDSGSKLTFGAKLRTETASKGNVIPIKLASGSCDDSISPSETKTSRGNKAAALSMDEPTIRLLPERQPSLPKDKKIPRKQPGKSFSTPGPVVILAPKTPRHTTLSATPYKARFTMGSVPAKPQNSPRRRSQRVASRITPSSRRVRPVPSIRAVEPDFRVPVKFDAGSGKRRLVDPMEASPNKRLRVNQVCPPRETAEVGRHPVEEIGTDSAERGRGDPWKVYCASYPPESGF
jgi:hypothetical protein